MRGGRQETPVRKRLKVAALHVMKAVGVFAFVRWISGPTLPILCYHGIWLGNSEFRGDAMFMRADTFEKRLALIKQLGYEVVSLDDATEMLSGHRELPKKALVITIDDGWFSTFSVMVPALHRHDFPATLYCNTASVLKGLPIANVMARYLLIIHGTDAPRSPKVEAARLRANDPSLDGPRRMEAVRELAEALGVHIDPYLRDRVFDYMNPEELVRAHASGLSVQLHTHNHTMHDLSPQAIEREVSDNRRALTDLLRMRPEQFRHFCYPSGEFDAGCPAALSPLGIVTATTTQPGRAKVDGHLLLLPRIMDGEQMTPIEFEAELAGVGSVLRRLAPF
jgi:peptidoglycan/xylan/chitin deacetylase (PgdA/CDA1 family)